VIKLLPSSGRRSRYQGDVMRRTGGVGHGWVTFTGDLIIVLRLLTNGSLALVEAVVRVATAHAPGGRGSSLVLAFALGASGVHGG
jgi:hypothetical protein